MKRVFLIGMGAGSLGHLTLDAVETLRRVDVVFVLDKEGAGKDELGRLRRELLERVAPEGGFRVVAATSPERTMAAATYEAGIDDWRRTRRDVIADLLERELGADETGAFLVWGDPCLYDGTIQILHELKAAGAQVSFDVIPGITSVQALLASHRVPLNRVGERITITTARELRETDPAAVTNTVVMLDGKAAFRHLEATDLHIYWGAYLGTADEILVAGSLRERAGEIERLIEEARARKGWIMDTYLLRKP